jgi:hypothetical protein
MDITQEYGEWERHYRYGIGARIVLSAVYEYGAWWRACGLTRKWGIRRKTCHPSHPVVADTEHGVSRFLFRAEHVYRDRPCMICTARSFFLQCRSGVSDRRCAFYSSSQNSP